MVSRMWIYVIISLILILFVTLLYSRREHFTGFSGYRATGCKNKSICINYYMNHYLNCLKNSGGVDTRGDCWNRIRPHIISCNHSAY